MRRAISWLYCAPKSRTQILFMRTRSRPPACRRRSGNACALRLAWRTQLLGALEHLAFGLDGRRDDQLRLLQLLDALRSHRAHAGSNGAHQVEGAILGEGGTEEDLLERAGDAHADARAARQVRVRGGHPPVIAAARRFLSPREGRADHDRVRARGEGFANVTARGHAAVGDDGHVAPRALVVEVTRGGGVRGGRHLRHAEAKHLAARAGGTRPHPDEHGVDAALHQLEARFVGHGVAHDERDGEVLLQLAQVYRRVLGGHVTRGGDSGLHHEEVRAGFLGDLGEALRALGDGGHHDGPAALLDLRDALVDQLFLDGLAVDALDDLGRFLEARGGDAVEDLVGIVVAGEDAFQIEHGEAAEAAHLDGELGADHAVHGRGDDGDLEAVATELPGNVDLVGIDGERAGNQRDVVEAVRRPGFAPTPHPHAHALSPSPGLDGSPARAPYIENRRLRPTVFRGSIRAGSPSVNPLHGHRTFVGCASSQMMRSPWIVRSESTTSMQREIPRIRSARPPVATTFTCAPISERIRSTTPSTSPAQPYTTPDWMLVTVLRPMASFGWRSSTRYRRAAREISASDAVIMPGAMAPPTNSPRAFTQSNVVAVPRLITMSGLPYRVTPPTISHTRSAPTSLGASTTRGTTSRYPGSTENAGIPK